MIIGRPEALDIFRKWFSERPLLKCDLRFPLFSLCFRGRVFGLADNEVKVLSDDTFTELALRIPDDASFGYGEPRDFPDEDKHSRCVVVVSFGDNAADNEHDFIAFEELIP